MFLPEREDADTFFCLGSDHIPIPYRIVVEGYNTPYSLGVVMLLHGFSVHRKVSYVSERMQLFRQIVFLLFSLSGVYGVKDPVL